MSQEVINNLVVELGLDSKEFESGLKNVNKSTKLLEQNFNGAKKALNVVEKDFDSLSKVISSGEGAIQAYSKKIDTLGDAYKEQEGKLKTFVNRQKELPDIISKAEMKLKELESTLGKSSDEYKKQENNLKTLKQEYAGMDNTLSKTVNSMRSLQNQIQQTETKMATAENEVKQFRNELEQLDSVDNSNLSSMFDGIDIGDFAGEIDGLSGGLDLLSLGAKGAGLALAGIFVSAVIDGAKDYDRLLTDLKITMGLTEEKAGDLQKKIMSFADGGYNIESIADAVQLLSQRFNMTDGEMEKVSQGMSVLNKYGYETNEMVRFITMAYDNFGMSATDAIGMIIRGQQQGMNTASDMMDTFIEYTPIFGQMGLDGQDAFNLINSAMLATGMDSDKVADMMKELTLTITDGSKASAEALDSLGIDVADLTSRIDSGKITMSDAFKEVSTAILGVEDETARATALQDIFKGTVEYGNQSVLESWINVQGASLDTAGAIDEVTTAYEGSYEASQQDFSNSWNELKQTIGSGVLPILTTVMETFNLLVNSMSLGISSIVLNIQTMANQLKAFFQEIQIGILETFVDNPIAEKLFPGMEERLATAKTQHEETINYIQENERKLAENAKASDELYKGSKIQTYDEVKNIADQKTKETSNVIDSNTKDGANKAKTNMDAMKNDVENSLSGLGNIALTSTGEIPKGTQQNLNASSQIIKQFGTDSYLGVRQSFQELEKSVKTSLDNVNKHITNNFNKATTDSNKNVEELYNLTREKFINIANIAKNQMASFARECSKYSDLARRDVMLDWSTMKSYIQNNPIKGSVTITKTTRYATVGSPEAQTLMEGSDKISTLNRSVSGIDFYSSRYKATPIVSKTTKNVERMNDSLLKETQQQNKLLTELLGAIMAERTTVVENTIQIDGKAIARGTARYMESEIANMNNRKNRLGRAY
ncbi:Phage-related minor tail protein [uncultured Clostridium sp.]|nr:Phage-related minor tail protein [uncultured Clostridium sp.]